jgi:exopolysaccharide biosynthesis polyprenyl glycosylphosphotransferase
MVASDAFLIAIVCGLSQIVRFRDVRVGVAGANSVSYAMVSASILTIWVVTLWVYGTYSPRVLGVGPEEYRRVFSATMSTFGAIAIVSVLFAIDVARGYLALALPLGLLAVVSNHWIARRFVARRRRHGKLLNAVLAVGQPHSVKDLCQSVARTPGDGYTVVGVCMPGTMEQDSLSIPAVGDVPVFPFERDIRHAVVDSGADTVMLTSGHLSPGEIRDLSWQLEKLDVDLLVSSGMVDVARPRLTVRPVGGSSMIHVDKPQYDGAKRIQKRVFDVGFALTLLIVVSPVMLLAALAVKLFSKGPVFYRSERIGLDGRPFQMIKFRTMVVDADQRLADVAHLNECDGLLFKIRDDPRVTRVGRFLRSSSIDELPQFINVLRKEMSVVGPRPPLPSEVEGYDDQVRRRLLVRPGITGLWQVSGRSNLSWEEAIRFDLSYVENWSMVKDLVIAMSTIRVVLRRSGAY